MELFTRFRTWEVGRNLERSKGSSRRCVIRLLACMSVVITRLTLVNPTARLTCQKLQHRNLNSS
jgi:hypothetical protein